MVLAVWDGTGLNEEGLSLKLLEQTASHATLRQTQRELWLVWDCSHLLPSELTEPVGFKETLCIYAAGFDGSATARTTA